VLAGQNAGAPASPGRAEVIMTRSADDLTAVLPQDLPDDRTLLSLIRSRWQICVRRPAQELVLQIRNSTGELA
jgi:hypothetical protein